MATRKKSRTELDERLTLRIGLAIETLADIVIKKDGSEQNEAARSISFLLSDYVSLRSL